MISRHAGILGLGEGLSPARNVLEVLVPHYAVAVVVHDRELCEV